MTDHLIDRMLAMKTRNGWVEIDRVRYDHDVIIHTDGSVTKRQKKPSKKFKVKYGHTPLSGAELGFLTGERPEIVYVGTGQYGDLPLTPDARDLVGEYDAVIRPTPEILDMIAEETRPFVAVLHVNC
jgi:hypothetical protein